MLEQNRATNYEFESDAEAHFEDLIDPYFHLIAQVNLKHLDGKNLRIDYLGWPKVPELLPLGLVGFELKRNYNGGFKSTTKVLKQAIDYRHSIIVSESIRAPYRGTSPNFVFVYPPLPDYEAWVFNQEHSGWVAGALRLAGRYNVGTVGFVANSGAVGLFACGARLWDAHSGAVSNLKVFGTNRKRGSE